MPLTLTLKRSPTVPLEVEGLTPRAAGELSPAELERFDIFHGNRKLPLSEYFQLAGRADDGRLRFVGDMAGVHWIGAGMDGGEILIEGNAGRHVGSEMTGGRIEVRGNVSDWLGGEMRGGEIHISGNAGHLVGAAYRGSRRGMVGGTILINGNAGNEIGHTMRRGTIAIAGTSGDLPGFNMIAGSIYLGGDCGIRPGAGMKRGTIAYLGEGRPQLLPTFRRATVDRFDLLCFALRSLEQQGWTVPEASRNARYELSHGDFLEHGRGEILVRQDFRAAS